MADDLRDRSIRTLAWLGDAVFELEVRRRLSSRGDFPTARLDAMKVAVARAETQAHLLEDITPSLTEEEQAVVNRGRNADTGRSKPRDTRTYRSATGLEALVGFWFFGSPGGVGRFEDVLGAPLSLEIDAAVAKHQHPPKRG